MRKLTKEEQLNIFKAHYKDFFTADARRQVKTVESFPVLTEVDIEKPILILCDVDIMRMSFIKLMTRLDRMVGYKLLSAYTLLDIYLGANEDYQSISELQADVLCFYLGYGEFENKRQSDVLIQSISNQVMLGKRAWVFYKVASKLEARRRNGDLLKFFEENDYNIVELYGKTYKEVDEL